MTMMNPDINIESHKKYEKKNTKDIVSHKVYMLCINNNLIISCESNERAGYRKRDRNRDICGGKQTKHILHSLESSMNNN